MCKLCDWTRLANPRNSCYHRSHCGGFGEEDYSSIFNISGFRSFCKMFERYSTTKSTQPNDSANSSIFGESSSAIADSTQSIQPLNLGDSFTITDNNVLCLTCGNVFPNSSQQMLDEHRQNCQLPPVNLVTSNTRPQAHELVYICFMCCERSIRPHVILHTSTTIFSRMSLTQALGMFMNLQSHIISENDRICSECFGLLNAYDKVATAAIKLKNQIHQRIGGKGILNQNNMNHGVFSGEANEAEDIINLTADEIEEEKENKELDVIDLDDDDDIRVDNIGQ